MRYPLLEFPLLDDPRWCIRRTIRDCRPYRSFHVGCQFGRSGSSGFAGNFRVNGVAFYGNTAVVVAFAVFIETVHFRPSQCVGNDGMVFAVVERPFFAEVVATFEHFDVGVVTVVFVVGYQSVGLVVFDHNVVAVGETAQFFAVASVNGGQITVAKIDFGKQQPCAAVGGGDLVEVV